MRKNVRRVLEFALCRPLIKAPQAKKPLDLQMPSPTQDNNNHDIEAMSLIDRLPLNGLQSRQHDLIAPLHPLLHYWQLLRKRKWIVLTTCTIVFSISVITTLSETRLY